MYRAVRPIILVAFAGALSVPQGNSISAAIDAYLQPYVQSGNFSGDVLIAKNGEITFEKAYGFADREHRVPITADTRFHVASISMQFTAAAVLRLVDVGSLSLDEHVGDFAPGIEGADKITIRNLLTERSGLPDINALPNYDEVLQHHQTPSSLMALMEGKPLLFEPGTKFLHEEHSAYNLLAFIVEKKTRLPFAAAIEKLVFRPLGLTASGVDDDSASDAPWMAKGYEPEGTYGLKPAKVIHWSGKTGNASVYTTAKDEAHWVEALFNGQVLSAASRDAVLDTSMRVGYGWFKGENKRFAQSVYYMNGRAPGFGSYVLYLPKVQTTVVVFGNTYSSATTPIGFDIAALSLGLPYQSLILSRGLSPAESNSCRGTFQFGPDFYQANAKVTLIANGRDVSLRWPSGEVSALVPLDRDQFMDRMYWQEVTIKRDGSGKPAALVYDHFEGAPSNP